MKKFIIPILALSLTLFSRNLCAADRPNIVFIISDDQAWGDYGFMGHPQLATPHLDKLAAASLTFQRGYTVMPLCRPSLASIVTGLYPHQHGVTGNDPVLPDPDVKSTAGRTNPKYARYYQTMIDNFATVFDAVRGGRHSPGQRPSGADDGHRRVTKRDGAGLAHFRPSRRGNNCHRRPSSLDRRLRRIGVGQESGHC